MTAVPAGRSANESVAVADANPARDRASTRLTISNGWPARQAMGITTSVFTGVDVAEQPKLGTQVTVELAVKLWVLAPDVSDADTVPPTPPGPAAFPVAPETCSLAWIVIGVPAATPITV